MARAATVQMTFPRFESPGVGTQGAPSVQPSNPVAQGPPFRAKARPSPRSPTSTNARANDVDERDDELEKARHALEKMKEKKRVKALKMELALAESEKQTESLLAEQEQAHERVEHDAQLEELLRLRKAGVPVQEALARIEGNRKPAKAVNNRDID
ncbi:MAG: hypothetical protein SF187_00440 [Deltaproteobacteria bacterium]|nr:hypothetical protein [Deltaproteobacteria bacterium]